MHREGTGEIYHKFRIFRASQNNKLINHNLAVLKEILSPTCDVAIFVKGTQNAQFSFCTFLKISELISLERKQILTSGKKLSFGF